MMIHAYDEIYLEDAMTNFAVMLDYGSQAYEGDIEEFYESFLASHVSCQFEKGNPQYIAGLSGIELAETVFVYQKVNAHEVDYLPDSCSDVYWAGWALAYFQWVSNFSFSFIQRSGLTIKRVLQMYRTFHEADISKFVEAAYEIIDKARSAAHNVLKSLRKNAGFTQQELAERSGVSLRMIRAYEQGAQDLGKAEARTLLNLSTVLGCSPEVLLY